MSRYIRYPGTTVYPGADLFLQGARSELGATIDPSEVVAKIPFGASAYRRYALSRAVPLPPRVNLSLHGGTIVEMLAWLAANPSVRGLIPTGEYEYSEMLSIPPGCDLLMQDVTLLPQDPEESSLNVYGAGTVLAFGGVCRIGEEGATNDRISSPHGSGISVGRSGFDTHDWHISADDLTIEGTAQTIMFFYRGCYDGVLSGTFTGINSAADSFHVTERSHHLDFTAATLRTFGSGDDMFPCVSYHDDLGMVHDIHWGQLYGRDAEARGIAVVGGYNIEVDYFDIDGTGAATIYCAAENSYDTFGVNGVTIHDGIGRTPNTLGIHNVSILAYNSQDDEIVTNLDINGDFDPDWNLYHKTGDHTVSNVVINGIPRGGAVIPVQAGGFAEDSSATTISYQLPDPVHFGHTIIVGFSWTGNEDPVSVEDDVGTVYTHLGDAQRVEHGYKLMLYGGECYTGGLNTVTVTFPGSRTNRRIILMEVSGFADLDHAGSNGQDSVVDGTDVITAGLIAPSIDGELVVGMAYCLDPATIVAGTGFTDQASASRLSLITQNQTTATPVEAVWTKSGGAPTDSTIAVVASIGGEA